MALPPELADLEQRIARTTGQSPSAIARQIGIDPGLFLGLISIESGGDPSAVSPAGAVGLTQLMPGTAAELGVTDATDPWQNLYAGARYLRTQLQAFGNPYDALRAYNAGPGGASGDPEAGRSYANKVLAAVGLESPNPDASESGSTSLVGGFLDDVAAWVTPWLGKGLAWLLVGLLVILGLWALVTSEILQADA